jgi:hypothetical protein
MTQIILQALKTRIVGLKKLIRLGGLLVVGGWVRGCARLYGVHRFLILSVGRVPGCCYTCGTISLLVSHYTSSITVVNTLG